MANDVLPPALASPQPISYKSPRSAHRQRHWLP